MAVTNILQPGTWDNAPSNGSYPERKYYRDAFASEFMMYWGQTKFSPEINELCFYRAITCFYREAMEDIEDRRRLLYHYLKGEFSTENADDALQRMAHQLPVDSFIPKALKNLCLAYKQAPQRTWGTEDDPSAYGEDFGPIYREMNFDRVMQDVSRLGKLCNVVAVRPWKHPLTGEMKVQILTPDMYRVEENRGEPVELWYRTTYTDDRAETQNAHRVWTIDRTYYADMEGAPIRGSEEPNPYGRVPFAFLRMESPLNDDPYGGSMFSLIEANLRANKKEFAADVGLVMNGFGVWVVTNGRMNEGQAKIAPDQVFAIDDVKGGDAQYLPTEVEHVVGNSMFSLVRDDKRQGIKDSLRAVGLPSSIVEENAGTPPSGISRILERVELLEQRDADKLALAVFEEEFAYLLAEVVRNDDYDADLPEEFVFAIDYAEERVYQEPQVEYEYYRDLAKNGDIDLAEYARVVMGLDEADAESVIEMIRERREQWQAAQGGGSTPAPSPQPTDEETEEPDETEETPTQTDVTDAMEDVL